SRCSAYPALATITLLNCAALSCRPPSASTLFFFTDPAPPAIYTLSLHDALPICSRSDQELRDHGKPGAPQQLPPAIELVFGARRSEEHTSELQSRENLVCRLLLEKKKARGRHADLRDHDELVGVHAAALRHATGV